MIIIPGFPIPPSDNDLKKPVRRYGKGGKRMVLAMADTGKYHEYRSDVNFWWMKYNQEFHAEFKLLKKWFQEGKLLHVSCDFRVHEKRIWNANGTKKKIDVQNRLKALLDCFSAIAHIDDSCFFKVQTEIVEIPNQLRECFYLFIQPIEPRREDEKGIGQV